MLKRQLIAPFAVLTLVACPDEVLVSPPGSVSGRICNPLTTQPEPGAAISVTSVDEAGNENRRETTTDDNGFFNLGGVAAGTQTLVVAAEAFDTSFQVEIDDAVIFQLNDPACRDLTPPPGIGRVAGQICNRHTGSLVTDAEVSVVLVDDTVLTTRTDAETGNFDLEVPTGTVVVSILAPDYRKTYVVEVLDQQTVVVEQSTDCEIPDPLSTGFITGKVCEPGTTDQPLEGAQITARYTGGDGSTYFEGPFVSLADGSFIIDPIGPTVATNVVVRAEKDDFVFTWNVDRVAARVEDIDGVDLTADVACQPLLPNDDRAYLVVEGQYDRIQDVLERMSLDNVDLHDGIPATLNWAEDLFGTQDIINGYDVVFVNCGVEELEFARGLSANAKRNIRRYVEQGGSLYVSDWAYELIEQVFPEKINFFGDDTTPNDAEVAIGGAYTATVVDPELAAEIELDEMTIDFSFQLGAVITDVAPDVTIYLETDMQYRREVGGEVISDVLPNTPVTVGFRHGLGRVIYTSFHQEGDETLEEDGPEDRTLRALVFEL